MPVLELEENVSAPHENLSKVRDYSHLKAYQFKAGHATAGPGRPKGRLNNATLLEQASPLLTRHYIKRAKTSDPVLIDAMKRILPVADEAGAHAPMIVVVVSDTAQPRAITVPADATPRLSASENVPALLASHGDGDAAR